MRRILEKITSLAPSLHFSGGWEKVPSENKLKMLAETSVKDEVMRFWEHLDLVNDKSITLERYLDDLLGSYYLTRKVMRDLPKKEQDVWRAIMNIIYETITLVFSDAVKRKVYLSIEFKSKWDNGERYFPWAVPIKSIHRVNDEIINEKTDTTVGQELNEYAREFRKQLVNCNRDAVMADLIDQIQGRKGKPVAMVLLAYEQKGYLRRGTYTIADVHKAFGAAGNIDSIRKYYNDWGGASINNDDKTTIEKMAAKIK